MASETEVVGAFSADMIVAEMVVEGLGVDEGGIAAEPETLVGLYVLLGGICVCGRGEGICGGGGGGGRRQGGGHVESEGVAGRKGRHGPTCFKPLIVCQAQSQVSPIDGGQAKAKIVLAPS